MCVLSRRLHARVYARHLQQRVNRNYPEGKQKQPETGYTWAKIDTRAVCSLEEPRSSSRVKRVYMESNTVMLANSSALKVAKSNKIKYAARRYKPLSFVDTV